MPRIFPKGASAPSDPFQYEAALELQRRRNARKSTLGFAQYVDPKYEPGAPHQIIAAALDEILNGDNDRLIVEAPPRHGKTEIGTRKFPALYLGKHPTRNVMSGSYDAELASDFGRDVRNLIANPRYAALFPMTSLAEDSQAKGRWHTAQGGGYLSGGIGGSTGSGTGFTGRGANLLVIDDPIKDRSSAESQATRDHIWRWYTSTAYTRLESDAAIVLIQTRWHEDDLAGRLQQEAKVGGDQWKVVTLSTIGDNNEIVSVWPERFPVKRLQRIMMALGGPQSRDWTALYGQRPTPQAGALFITTAIPVIDAPPVGTAVRAWDLGATRQVGSRDPSWTVGVRMVKTGHNRFAVTDIKRLRDGPDKVEEAIFNTASQDGAEVQISLPQDPGQAGKAQVQSFTAKLIGYNVVSSPETGDKATRAAPYIAQCNVGNVALVRGPWNRAYLEELASFPNGAHDDQVDASSRAFNTLAGNNALSIWEALGEQP